MGAGKLVENFPKVCQDRDHIPTGVRALNKTLDMKKLIFCFLVSFANM